MSARFEKARRLVREFKGHSYAFGRGALARVGEMAAGLEWRAALVNFYRACLTRLPQI